MAYSASALSFMLENLEKPVIFTGSQLPVGMLRTDGKENLISSIELAAARDNDGHPCVPEVCIYFESKLFRGNRTTKDNAENFRAFRSANYPALADVGIHIKYNEQAIRHPRKWGKQLKIFTKLDTSVAVLKIFPGMNREYVDSVLNMEGLRGLILETFGSGNAPASEWFLNAIEECAIKRDVVVFNVSQCKCGSVDMNAYSNGIILKNAGVISGNDITFESALSKLFFLLGQYSDNREVRIKMAENLRGEISNK